jgi:hypothetical protein
MTIEAYRQKVLAADSERPWAIFRVLPDSNYYIVARFRNRQDAHDHLRMLNRYMPGSIFEIIFDIPNDESNF